MRTRLLPFCLAAIPLLAQTPFTWGPALYSLRATNKVGGSLVLMDEKGQETTVDRDDRTASGGGLMSSVLYHASFYGTFTASSDLKTVVFTKHGKVKAPFSFGISGFSGGSGGGSGYSAAFGEHDLEGIYAWDRATGKSTRLWDQDGLISQLKAWVKTPEGALFSEVDLKDEVRANRPAYLFHLGGSRFVWVNGASAFDLDMTTKTARILFSDLDKGRVAGGGSIAKTVAGSGMPGGFHGTSVTLSFSQRPALTTATQNADGSLTLFRPGMLVTIPVEGPVQIASLGEGHRMVWSGPEALTLSNGETLRTLSARDPKPEAAASSKLENSVLQPSLDGRSTFVYKHFKTKDDTLSKVGVADGKAVWTTPLGDCRFGVLLAEAGDQVHVLVRRSSGDVPMHMLLNGGTGALMSQEPWFPGEALEKRIGGYPAPVELADRAVLVPCSAGYLVWVPSHGEVEGLPAGSWSGDASALAQAGAEVAVDGQWCLLTPQLALKPLAHRPLVDQMVVVAQNRMEPVMNWINQGICQSSNPGDRAMASLNKKPLAFFIRDFGFWAPPSLSEFASRVVAPKAP